MALAAVEAFFGAGAADRRSTWTRCGRRSPRCARPGRLERVAAGARRPTVLVDAAHNPHGARALAAAADRRVPASPGWSAWSAAMRDKDVRGILAELEPVLAEVVVTANSSPRAMDPDELAALAV